MKYYPVKRRENTCFCFCMYVSAKRSVPIASMGLVYSPMNLSEKTTTYVYQLTVSLDWGCNFVPGVFSLNRQVFEGTKKWNQHSPWKCFYIVTHKLGWKLVGNGFGCWINLIRSRFGLRCWDYGFVDASLHSFLKMPDVVPTTIWRPEVVSDVLFVYHLDKEIKVTSPVTDFFANKSSFRCRNPLLFQCYICYMQVEVWWNLPR